MKILISDKLAQEGVDILKEAGFEVDCRFGITPEELKKAIKGYHALIVRSGTKVTSDVIEAAGGVKLILFPLAASIAGYEFLADKWQWTMYWSPFYWAYKGNSLILSKTADWETVILCTGMVAGLSAVVYLLARHKLRKGLS